VKGVRGYGAKIDPIVGELPRVDFQWDAETEILSGVIQGVEPGRGLTGSIELEDAKGAVITLDFEGGVLRAVEVVVWPPSSTVEGLTPPKAGEQGRLVVPSRPSQPGIAVVEVDLPLGVERSPDESVVHLRVGSGSGHESVALADHLLVEFDQGGDLAGFWLLAVPPFPESEGTR
jgi:hypothetical protein